LQLAACVAACSDVLACGSAACSCSCSPCDSAHCLHTQSAQRACTAHLRAAAACSVFCRCLCACWSRGGVWCGNRPGGPPWPSSCGAGAGCGCGYTTLPPAQPWPWRGKLLCVVRVSPECPCTRKGSAAAQQACQQRPAEVHQGGSSTPRSSAQQHAQFTVRLRSATSVP
jgi:hypothetical protein